MDTGSNKNDEFHWNQLVKLGDMMGDGLHHEPDGKWITKEYKRLSKMLIPELKQQQKEKRKLKSIHINEQMDKLLQEKKCSCGGALKQKRSGSKVCYCSQCNKRHIATSRK